MFVIPGPLVTEETPILFELCLAVCFCCARGQALMRHRKAQIRAMGTAPTRIRVAQAIAAARQPTVPRAALSAESSATASELTALSAGLGMVASVVEEDLALQFAQDAGD